MTIWSVLLLVLAVTNSLADFNFGKECPSGVTFHGKNADKVVELLSNGCGKDKECDCDNEDSEGEQEGTCTVKKPSDCSDLDKSMCKSGIYKIYPDRTSGFNVFCEMEKNGGGWTVIQRRMNGHINFYRDWEAYKRGFGNMKGEHWLGNEHLHQLTSQGKYMLRVDMSDFVNSKRHAVYSKFSVGSESSGYKLDITGYSGDTGDSMKRYQNGNRFSTMDKDLDTSGENCAEKYKGGWWYGACHESNLNGLYHKGSHTTFADGVNWKQWKGYNYSLKTTTMMIRKA
ncbi:microfibril-associated glycoprotein 4-like [Mytilus californianus]|uniref:microfibril-associated glycoprotein 4-like n=1 Tax=Mytilus californianus TaxID=6549 RepID=UPI0022479F34|nr:microfibril-associated glycoprotein 4-like [Mytilus californianus]